MQLVFPARSCGLHATQDMEKGKLVDQVLSATSGHEQRNTLLFLVRHRRESCRLWRLPLLSQERQPHPARLSCSHTHSLTCYWSNPKLQGWVRVLSLRSWIAVEATVSISRISVQEWKRQKDIRGWQYVLRDNEERRGMRNGAGV